MRNEIDRVIEQGGFDRLAETLDGARATDFRYAARRLRQTGSEDGSVLDRAEAAAGRGEPSIRHLASRLVAEGYREDPTRALGILQRLADDPDWTVRDAAAEVCGRLLRRHFETVHDTLRSWRSHASPSVRRAVVIAAGRAARPSRPEWAEPLLKLVEPLLVDRDPTLRKNLGPSTIGLALLKRYPTETFEYIVNWSTSCDEQVLWNVAAALAGPAAAPLAKKALIVLRKLSLDERRYVWRAVASAMWKLGRKRPEVVRPELARWLEDERRDHVAREAMRFL